MFTNRKVEASSFTTVYLCTSSNETWLAGQYPIDDEKCPMNTFRAGISQPCLMTPKGVTARHHGMMAEIKCSNYPKTAGAFSLVNDCYSFITWLKGMKPTILW